MSAKPLVLLVQLPIPPLGPEPIEGNVPLAAAYLKLFAERQGLHDYFDIELFPLALANRLGDLAMVEAILERRPVLVGFSCYLWNIDRSLWVAGQLKNIRPDLKIVLGGPEITADNAWTLQHPAVDYAILGEGEQPFVKLLASLSRGEEAECRPCILDRRGMENLPLDAFCSPYIAGMFDSIAEGWADRGRMSLETARGCRYRCKYCYYPKSHDTLRFLSPEAISANLKYALEHGISEIVLLDPTLNQRPDFAAFLELLRQGNGGGRLAYSGELRAEGVTTETARLLRAANFQEVEIGLQSVEPEAWRLMGRPTNLPAFEQGVRAMLAEGIRVQVDLILGLPGDTPDSIRRGIDYLHQNQLYSQAAVFNLSILPGTAFRRDADTLGLKHQPWPPYYVVQTPTLDVEAMYSLMAEAQEAFGVEFDARPAPRLDQLADCSVTRVDLDAGQTAFSGSRPDCCSPHEFLPSHTSLAHAIWFRSSDFDAHRQEAAAFIERFLKENPHTTLAVVMEPCGEASAWKRLSPTTMEMFLAACYRTPSYLDRYYSLHPGELLGSKRLIILLEPEQQASRAWQRRTEEFAEIVEKN